MYSLSDDDDDDEARAFEEDEPTPPPPRGTDRGEAGEAGARSGVLKEGRTDL